MCTRIVILLLAAVLIPVQGLRANITSFTQSPPGILTPGSMVVFNCQAIGFDVTWFINGFRRDASYSDYIVSIDIISSLEHWNISVSTIASIDKNNTCILCYASGRITGQMDRQFANITIAGPPLAPQPRLQFLNTGATINVQWHKPYSPEGFPITSYSLEIFNLTSNTSDTFLLQPEQLDYNLSNPDLTASTCHQLQFAVTARNVVGESNEGVTSGQFPIGSQVYYYAVQDISSLSIRVSFNVTPTCFSQPPGNACVSVFDSNGQLATRTSTAISHSQLNVQCQEQVLTVTNRPLLDQFNLTLYIEVTASTVIPRATDCPKSYYTRSTVILEVTAGGTEVKHTNVLLIIGILISANILTN